MIEPTFSPLLTSKDFPDLHIQQPEVCLYCQSSPLRSDQTHCPVCAFPQQGSQEEKQHFIEPLRTLAQEHEQCETTIGFGQTLMQVLAGLQFISAYMTYSGDKRKLVSAAIAGVIGVLLLVLYQLSKKFPLQILIATMTLITLSFIDLVLLDNFTFIISAVLIRLIVLVALGNALWSYYKAVAIEEQLNLQTRLLEWTPTLGH